MTTPLTITSLDQGKIFVHPFDRADAKQRAEERAEKHAERTPGRDRSQPGLTTRIAVWLRLVRSRA